MSLLEAAIAIISPPQCINCGKEGLSLCADCADSFIIPFGERCWRCNSLSPGSRTCESCRHTGSPSHVWIVTDHDGPARGLLSIYKFGHQRPAVEPIANLMADIFNRYNPDISRDYLLVPVPTATQRIRERGFGHTELLAGKLSKKLSLQSDNALRRLGQARQLGSRREDRLVQLSSSFMVKHTKLVANRRILLIDDVVTTGGTLIAATKALRAAGAKQVDALLFAKRL